MNHNLCGSDPDWKECFHSLLNFLCFTVAKIILNFHEQTLASQEHVKGVETSNWYLRLMNHFFISIFLDQGLSNYILVSLLLVINIILFIHSLCPSILHFIHKHVFIHISFCLCFSANLILHIYRTRGRFCIDSRSGVSINTCKGQGHILELF